jgi:uncharacterized membrane protein YbaN (DUF454 family)
MWLGYKNGSLGMKKFLQKHLLVILGWFFTLLGAIGIILPILPTTPFLIVALVLFSKSSPKFHQMLLNSAWFGPTLKQWEDNKTLSRKTKYKAFFLIIITFSISIAILDDKIQFQLLLVGIAIVLLIFIWRIKEPAG